MDYYQDVNEAWPQGELPVPTGQEAISAVKRLYRFGMGKAFKGSFKITSGRNYTRIRGGIYFVNPNREGGWKSLVHSVSHTIHARKNVWTTDSNIGHHDWRHARIEKMLIEHVVKSGWLEGKLKRAEKQLPDNSTIKLMRVLEGIARWEAKEKRARNALKKLYRQRKYYQK